MVAGEIQEELDIPASTLSHHLEKLRQVGLVSVRRAGTFLWYTANTERSARSSRISLRRVLHAESRGACRSDCANFKMKGSRMSDEKHSGSSEGKIWRGGQEQ